MSSLKEGAEAYAEAYVAAFVIAYAAHRDGTNAHYAALEAMRNALHTAHRPYLTPR